MASIRRLWRRADVDAQIRVDGDDHVDQFASLWAWLQGEDELRGRMRVVEAPIGATELGGVFDCPGAPRRSTCSCAA
jgi:hypothetical protein